MEPKLAVIPLSAVTPGSLVQYEGKLAFCGFSPRDPDKTRVLFEYNAAKGQFIQSAGASPDVLVFQDPVVLTPALESYFENGRPDGSTGTELFLAGEKLSVVLHVGSSWRLLDLTSGIYESLQAVPLMSGFTTWSLGVRDGVGKLTVLLSFQTLCWSI